MERLLPRALHLRTVLLAAILFAVGCGSGGPKLYSVRGKLLINGQPAEGAKVAFYPKTPFAKTMVPLGVTKADGTFVLGTNEAEDGAPAGEYEVSVTWPESRPGPRWREGPDRLNRKYANPKTSSITATVEAKSGNEIPPFNLQADLPAADPNQQKGPKESDH
jgi:hypothetical protein